jgi:hypothetical protein
MTLAELQKRMATAVMRPLTAGERTAEENAEYIKPNDRLTSVERLEIYNRQYWFRVIDSLYEDFPGLRAVVGDRAFDRLVKAYLAECPSHSFTLRNLGSRLGEWLVRNPAHAGTKLDAAIDMIRLEWAEIEAFDGPARKPAGPEDLIELSPDLRFSLQPYITLLELQYPVDELRLRVNAVSAEPNASSNAVVKKSRGASYRAGRLKREHVFLAVHRHEGSVYFRRLRADEFRLLSELRDGTAIAEAIATAFAGAESADAVRETLETCFATWSELGWLCPYAEGQ